MSSAVLYGVESGAKGSAVQYPASATVSDVAALSAVTSSIETIRGADADAQPALSTRTAHRVPLTLRQQRGPTLAGPLELLRVPDRRSVPIRTLPQLPARLRLR
ncbi:MAG: hypothetical protein ABFS14_06045, partial [Gemmatimonadota bacterium]